MAAPEYRTWLMALTTVLVFVGRCQCDLILIMDRNVTNDYCGRLHCWNQGHLDNDILNISAISVYDISQPGVIVLLASVPNDGSGIMINQFLISNITGAGSIDGFNAGLSVNFKNPQDCEFGSFLCELEYVDVNGQRDTMTVEDRASSSNQCTCSAINSNLSKLSEQLENNTRKIDSLIQDNTALNLELSDLRQHNSNLLLQFQNLSSQVSLIQDYLTSVQTSSSTTATTTQTSTPDPVTITSEITTPESPSTFSITPTTPTTPTTPITPTTTTPPTSCTSTPSSTTCTTTSTSNTCSAPSTPNTCTTTTITKVCTNTTTSSTTCTTTTTTKTCTTTDTASSCSTITQSNTPGGSNSFSTSSTTTSTGRRGTHGRRGRHGRRGTYGRRGRDGWSRDHFPHWGGDEGTGALSAIADLTSDHRGNWHGFKQTLKEILNPAEDLD